MLRVKLEVKLILEGPILTKSSVPGRYGMDASMALNYEGKYMIPGTLVKGRLRQAWQELGDLTSFISKEEIVKLLGDESGNRTNQRPVNPMRSIIKFSDFVSEKQGSKIFHRIRIDEEKGTVAEGAILTMETPFAPGEKVCFYGSIDFIAKDQQETNRNIDYIKRGLRWISGLGSERSVGFGKLLNVEIDPKITEIETTPKSVENTQDGRLGLVLIPKEPFCIAKRQINGNLYESEIFIPGSAIKGIIASTWLRLIGLTDCIEIKEDTDNSRKELCKNFNKIRVRHAFPAKSSVYKRPIFPPLSIAKVSGCNSYYDVALCDKPILINNKAPQFDIDWKDDSDVKKEFGWDEPSKELRVRTAIDMKTRRAKEDRLFAYEMIVPKGYHWLTYIDFGSVPENERGAVERQLRELLEYGLSGLGKTKAEVFAEVKEHSNIQPYSESNSEPIYDHYIITLQTPAIICDPSKLDEASGKGELFNAYIEAWNDISDNSLSLVRYFARQSLAGGYYIHRRFQEGKKYKPYLLTNAGSVFVLKTVNEGAKEKIRDWLNNGLPLPKWAKEEYKRDDKEGDHWSNCPYIRENGYGEIAVNLDIHRSKMPKEESVCQITGYGE